LQTSKGFGQLYKIKPLNGDSFTINKNHILCFKISNHDTVCWDKARSKYMIRWIEKSGTGLPQFASTRIKCETEEQARQYLAQVPNKVKHHEIIELSFDKFVKLPLGMQQALKLYRTGIEYPKYKLTPLDPYLLGYWLGDGTSSAPQI